MCNFKIIFPILFLITFFLIEEVNLYQIKILYEKSNVVFGPIKRVMIEVFTLNTIPYHFIFYIINIQKATVYKV
jgi:hypothetical protein